MLRWKEQHTCRSTGETVETRGPEKVVKISASKVSGIGVDEDFLQYFHAVTAVRDCVSGAKDAPVELAEIVIVRRLRVRKSDGNCIRLWHCLVENAPDRSSGLGTRHIIFVNELVFRRRLWRYLFEVAGKSLKLNNQRININTSDFRTTLLRSAAHSSRKAIKALLPWIERRILQNPESRFYKCLYGVYKWRCFLI